MNGTLRLSDVLGRTVVVDWFEAVALSRAVSDRVTQQYDGRSVPDLPQIELGTDGQVTISSAVETTEPVRRLGQLLQALLTQSEPPVQLRLMVGQATAPVPSFATVQDFSDALGYFERPDRTGVLRRLYARASLATEVPAVMSPTVETMAPLRSQEPAPTKQAAAVQVAKRRLALAVTVLVAIVAAGWTYIELGSSARAENVSALAVRASDALGGAVVSGLSKASETVGLGRLAPADSSGSIPPTPLAVPPLAGSRPKASSKGKSNAAAPLLVFDLDTAPVLVAGAAPISPVPPLPAGAAEPEGIDERIYSSSDPTVTAPVGVRPQLPRVLPSDINKNQLSQIELIIGPDGTVESVRLFGPRSGVREGMLLSAAKAWTFSPAMKDGKPVSYRKFVWLVLQ